MQLINDGKINTIAIQLPLLQQTVRNEWEYYVEKFHEKINDNLKASGRKEWTLGDVSKRLRFARIKNHHIREFFEECEDKGFNPEKYNFYIHFFSKTKITFKTIK